MSFMYNNAALANVDTGDRPAARASTKYMETFQLVQPALGGTDIQTYPNAVGNLDVYTIGTNDAIHRLRRGRDADAPYEDTNLNITGRQLYLYTNNSDNSDTPNIMTLGTNGQLKVAIYQSAVSSYFQTETKPANATESILQFKGARGLTGNIYVNVMLQVPNSDLAILANNFFKPGTTTWAGPVWVPLKGPDGQNAQVKALAMVENNPVQSAIFAIGKDDYVWFAESSDRTAQLRSLGVKKVTQLSVVVDAKQKLNIFAVEKDTGRLLLKKEKDYSVGGQIQFDDWVYLDQGAPVVLKSVYASLCFNDLLQVFGIGDDGRLWRAAQAPATTRGGKPTWMTMFPLGNEIPSGVGAKASIFAVGRDVSGYSEAYTVSAEGAVTRFWQSATSQQWFDEHVQLLRTDNQMVSVPTHALELTVLDEGGIPQANVPIAIQASFLVTLFVNGRSYRCSQVDRVAAITGPGGKVVIQQKANALAGATLYVETGATLAGAPLVIQPNLQLQEKLETLSVNEIKDAKDASGNYLLPPEYRTDECAQSLQQITQSSMQIAAQDENGKGKVNYLTVSRVASRQRFKNQLNLAQLEGTSWAIDFSSGFPTYQTMTSQQVADWKSQKLTAMKATMGAEAPAGFLGIDWGSVWNGIKNGVKWIVDGIVRIVVEVVEGIGRVLFEIAGKVFEAIIEFAQQAFDFIQGVWNWLKVKLEQLFEWLAFLFNIKDMVRTAEAIRHTTGVLLDFTVAGVEAMKQTILSGIDTMKSELMQTVDSFIAILNKENNPSYGSYSTANNPSDDELYQTEHNPFADSYDQNIKNASENAANATTLLARVEVSDPLERLLQMFQDLANNFQYGDGKQAFEEALGFFTAIGDDPNNVLNLLLSGVIKALEGIALFALDTAKGVVALMMDLIKEVVEAFKLVLFTEWEIPILSQLYKLFTGKTLSIRPVDIACYIVGVPATLAYKLLTGTAPFPDDAALDAYKNYFTVDWLKSKFGLETSKALTADFDVETFIAKFCLVAYGVTMCFRVYADGITALLSTAGETWAPAGYCAATLAYISMGLTTPWLLNWKTPAPSCPAGSLGFGGTIWICSLIFGPTRGLLLGALFKLFKVDSNKIKIYTAELTLTAWGAAATIMTIWNYVELPSEAQNGLALARALTNMIPGQLTRFLFLPDIQGGYYIPAAIGAVLTLVGYVGSMGCAFEEAKKLGSSAMALGGPTLATA
jgi:hypothetical protein